MEHFYQEENSPPAAATAEGESTRYYPNAESVYARTPTPHKAKSRKKDAVTFRSVDGREWTFRGKVGRTLLMLATRPGGVTQHDAYPWRTRLAGSVFLMRSAGLIIEMTREGECGHARYVLKTEGSVLSWCEEWEAIQ